MTRRNRWVAVLAVLWSASSALAAGPVPIGDAAAATSHTFRYTPPAGTRPKAVCLAGDFNDWSPTSTPMAGDGAGFVLKVDVSEGVHAYKFVVDGHWTPDPAADPALSSDDGNQGRNSGVRVGPDPANLPPVRADAIDAAAVAFDPTAMRDCDVVDATALRLSVQTQAGDVADAAVLVRTTAGWQPTPMVRSAGATGFERFSALVLPGAATARYVFELKKPGTAAYVAGRLAYPTVDAAESAAYSTPMTPAFVTPDWAKHAVWYQIFPERFRNGDPSNDPPNTLPWKAKWFSKQPGETGNFYGRDVWARRYGGDIQGCRQALPYLRSLGVTAIYINPIFQAEDLHKYDTSDYRHVDEHFGVKGDIEQLRGETDDPATWQWTASDRVFLDFVADAHRQGFRVIIDGVFNHTGKRFWAFQDVVKNGRGSKYAGWFDVTSWSPLHYNAWDGRDGFLPALKKDRVLGLAHGPREHVFAVTRRWLAPDGDPSRGVDGFRLDAPTEINHTFWAEYRTLVKRTKPDAYVDGEIWPAAGAYLKGNEYDGVMNYQFAMASQGFFVDRKNATPPTVLNAKAMTMVLGYPFQAALVNQNLLDSHDTDRAASMFVNPDLPFDGANRIEDNGPHYSTRKPEAAERRRMLQEVAWQMTFAGAPMIYYGDEAGMWSPDDPSDRQPMLWKDLGKYDDPEETFDDGKFDYYRRLIAVRRAEPALQTGFYRPVVTDDAAGVFAYARDLGPSHAYAVLNRSDRERQIGLPIPDGQWVDWLNDPAVLVTQSDAGDARPSVVAKPGVRPLRPAGGTLTLTLPAYGSAVLGAMPAAK